MTTTIRIHSNNAKLTAFASAKAKASPSKETEPVFQVLRVRTAEGVLYPKVEKGKIVGVQDAECVFTGRKVATQQRLASDPAGALQDFLSQKGEVWTSWPSEAVFEALRLVCEQNNERSDNARWASIDVAQLIALRAGISGGGNPAKIRLPW